jgi:hypothetical protein
VTLILCSALGAVAADPSGLTALVEPDIKEPDGQKMRPLVGEACAAIGMEIASDPRRATLDANASALRFRKFFLI